MQKNVLYFGKTIPIPLKPGPDKTRVGCIISYNQNPSCPFCKGKTTFRLSLSPSLIFAENGNSKTVVIWLTVYRNSYISKPDWPKRTGILPTRIVINSKKSTNQFNGTSYSL